MTHQHAPVLLDIAGTTLTAADRRRLKHPLTGGLTLFARNWQDRAQLTALCAEIKSVREDLLICVDHEGGRVQRFRTDGFTHLPAMRVLGEMWMKDALTATDAVFSIERAQQANSQQAFFARQLGKPVLLKIGTVSTNEQ